MKISTKKFPSGHHALKYAIGFITEKYFKHGITPEQVIILSNDRLKTILPRYHKQFLLNESKMGDVNVDTYEGGTRAKFKLHYYTY